MSQKTVITAALTGVLATREQCPAIPYTAHEIAQEARRSLDAGAAIVHIHARQPDGRPAFDVESYRLIDEAVRALCPQAIINYSTGAVGIDRETRVAHIRTLAPPMAALNMGSMNYAMYSREKKRFYHDHIFENRFEDICFYLAAMNAVGTRPEMECFDLGHIHNAEPLRDLGILPEPSCYSLVMGVLGGIPASTRNLLHMVESLPRGAHWQAIGIGRVQWPLLAAAITLEGHVRVGLEDNFYLKPGLMAASNGELVEKAARLIEDLGGQVASPQEARQLLGLGSSGPAA
jgi:3-keto-5-aminohexanoate cleavage enzyme